jgi:hypothetical protein
MPLTLRPTDLSSPVCADQLDYTVFEDGRAIGRMYEDQQALSEWRWFWSITVYVDPKFRIDTHGRVASLEAAKERFRVAWLRCRSNGVRG